MSAVLDYCHYVFNKIVQILNIEFFTDFPVSFLDLILAVIILRYVFKFIFGGFKEVEGIGNYQNQFFTSRTMNNLNRKYQLARENRSKAERDKTFSGRIKAKQASPSEIAEIDNLFNNL